MSERLRDINPEKIEQLTTEHIARLVNKYGLTPQEAEDIVQEVMTNIIARGTVDELEPYLFKALKNRALNFVGNKSPRDGKKDWRERHHLPLLDGDGNTRCGWEDETILRIDLNQAAETLTSRQQVVLYELAVEELTQQEVADKRGIHRVSVATLLARARSAMKRELGEDYLLE